MGRLPGLLENFIEVLLFDPAFLCEPCFYLTNTRKSRCELSLQYRGRLTDSS